MKDKAELLKEFEIFCGSGGGIENWLSDSLPDSVAEILLNCQQRPISVEVLNQLLILSHEGGMSLDFFKFYFLRDPHSQGLYWYDPKKLVEFNPAFLTATAIISLQHLKWGLKRLYIDGLLHFGNIRQCYRTLRTFSEQDFVEFFKSRSFNRAEMASRSDHLPLEQIAKDSRYLIAEVACKTYAPADESIPALIDFIKQRYEALMKEGKRAIKVKDLIADDKTASNHYDTNQLSFSLDEAIEKDITDSADIEKEIGPLVEKFRSSREKALKNTHLYLSMVADLDAYVATSMRNRTDFRSMADFCEQVFSDKGLQALKLRYFDPTLSAAENHEDKGLIECLMVKCAKILIYNAGRSDSYGKDAEAAMALSLGKPVIFYCDTETKQKIFKEIHPLARLINFHNGVAIGSIVIDNVPDVVEMVRRIFENDMQLELVKKADNYFLLRESLTGSTIRVQSSNLLLRETFWNYYHQQPPYRRG